MIATPTKQLILPPGLFHSMDEAMRLSRPEDGHNLDLQMVLEVKDANGFSQGRQRRQCHSYLKQFIDFLCASGRAGDVSSKDWANNTRTVRGSNRTGASYYNFDTQYNAQWLGPCVGTGTTSPTISDYQMEQPVWHGTAAPNASAASGTWTSRYYTDPVFYMTKTAAGWSTNQWANYILRIASGAATGQELRINSNTSTICYCGHTTPDTGIYPFAFPTTDPGATADYIIKTYGQLSYSNGAYTAPTDDGDKQSRFSISRDFTNSQGATFTVNECGLLAAMSCGAISGSYQAGIPLLMIRDVLSPGVELLNTQVLTLTYDFIVNA